MNKNILIIGGAGFIGVNSAKYFLDKNCKVTIFDNFLRQGTRLNVDLLKKTYPQVKVIEGDIRYDFNKLKELAEENEVFLHLAAQVAVTTSVKAPREDFEINALGTFNVLEAARQSVKHPIILYSSTNKVYGGLESIEVVEGKERYDFKDLKKGVSESMCLDFHSPYGCSKGAADQYVHDYSRIYGLKTIVFRQSCIYGRHQFGVEDQGWVAWFLIAAIFGKPLTIYGNGKQVRDILFVDDLVRAYYLAIDNFDKTSGQVYNIGGGYENTISLLEFLDILKNELDFNLNYSFSDWRPGDQPIFVSDNSKIGKHINWKPEINPIEGIKQLVGWLKEHKEIIEKFYI